MPYIGIEDIIVEILTRVSNTSNIIDCFMFIRCTSCSSCRPIIALRLLSIKLTSSVNSFQRSIASSMRRCMIPFRHQFCIVIPILNRQICFLLIKNILLYQYHNKKNFFYIILCTIRIYSVVHLFAVYHLKTSGWQQLLSFAILP